MRNLIQKELLVKKLKKTQNLLLLIFLVTIFASCEEDDPILKEEIIDGEVINITGLVEDINTNQINCNVNIDSLHPDVTNVLAYGVDLPSFITQSSIFKGESSTEFGYYFPITPIIEFHKNELSVRKIIASWNQDELRSLTDSVFHNVNSIDSNYHEDIVHSDIQENEQTSVFVNLLSINRYGYVNININNPEINNYLKYKTDKFSDIENDSIDLSPEIFRNQYGDATCNSLTLGTCNLMQGMVSYITADSTERGAALKEAVEKVRMYLTTDTDWSVLVKDSKYLKKSSYTEWTQYTTSGCYSSVLGGYNEHMSDIDIKYREGDFDYYSIGVRPYSDIYPNYKFVEVDFPNNY